MHDVSRPTAGPAAALRPPRHLLSALAALALVLGALIGLPAVSQAAGSLPCDIYGAAGTPCVAAHSTTRALLSSYAGPLYQVTRASDGARTDV
ncbi:alpha-L-arabinofuranosidase, partial [Streptomyces sp. SID625]|nr:alpha-L-arabinofuranosidase [Streptomyces sp. SID625]